MESNMVVANRIRRIGRNLFEKRNHNGKFIGWFTVTQLLDKKLIYSSKDDKKRRNP